MAAAVFVAVGAVSFIAVYGQAMTADTATRAEQATRQTAAALENYLSNMEEKLNRIAAEITADSLGSARELDVAVRLYTDVEAVMLWRADGSLAVCSAGDRQVKSAAAGSLSFDARAFDAGDACVISLPHVGNLYEADYPWVVTLTRRLDAAAFGEEIAIAVDFSFSGIAQYIDNVGYGKHGYCYVIDRDGETVYHPQQQMLYARIVNRPVNRLVRAMQAFERAAETYAYAPMREPVAELQTLSDSFGHMVGMVQGLMAQIKAEELSLRKTELKALQAQINPHFLYNTLDSIQWMCEQGKNEDAVRMISALARLFRISISRGHELIPIRDELRHAESYLVIQSYRYRDRFAYSFEADEALLGYLCNKITIQPLIENAIYHGIGNMPDDGVITVRVRRDPDAADADTADILIEVEDNGVGMTEAQCAAILRKERSDSSGIGIKNVNDRLKIFFGERYGITIRSELDAGTCVTVRLPRVEKEDEA